MGETGHAGSNDTGLSKSSVALTDHCPFPSSHLRVGTGAPRAGYLERDVIEREETVKESLIHIGPLRGTVLVLDLQGFGSR